MRYLLSLCILFLSGFTPLAAHSSENAYHALSWNPTDFTIATIKTEQNDESGFFTFFSSDSEKKGKNNLVDVAEVKAEEDESHFLKKTSQNNTYYSSKFDAKSAIYFFHFLKNRTSLCKQFSYHSSSEPLNVTFGVFRL